MTIVPAWSQTPQADKKRQSINVQVVVLGQPVPPRYEIVERVRIKGLDGSEAEGGGESVPAQEMENVPLQIAPEPDELPPSPLYIKTGNSWQMIPVRENTASPKVSVSSGANVVVATATKNSDANGEVSMEYNPLGEFEILEGQEEMLILIVKDPRQPLKWKILRSLAIDTSWSELPAGSFSIFNASFLTLRGIVSRDVIDPIKNFSIHTLRPDTDDSGKVPYILEVQHPDGTWNTIVNSSNTLSEGSRIIAIPYAVVRPKTKRYASLMIIRDFQGLGGLDEPETNSRNEDGAIEELPE